MSNLHYCHPLRHEGTSRIARLVRALQPDAFRLDERTLQDLIVATHQYAQSLRYFDHSDQHPDHAYWEGFWEVEMLTYLAVVAVTDTDEIRRQYEAADAQLTKDLGVLPVPGMPGAVNAQPYRPLLEMLRALALSLEEAYQKLVRIQHPLQNLLLARIKRDNCCDPDELVGALTRLIAYHKGVVKPLEWPEYAGFFAPDSRWGLVNRVDYDAIAANPNFAQEDLRELFVLLLDTWLVLKTAAQENFEAELARIELPEDVEYRIVQPHVVLFLVFLRLFRHAQDSLNDLGARHLDYYYEQVLGLRRRDEIPDDVYLLFELAKDVNQHLLEKGTEFLAGKDKNGAPLFFESLEDWVLRPAQVADLKNTRIDSRYGRITANPDVKKAYAIGAEKPNEAAKSWRSMGDDADLPNGEVGFAIASPQLILREGKRVVDVTLQLTSPLPTSLSWLGKPNLFRVYLSAEETWIKLEHRPDRVSAPEGPAPDLDRGAFNIFWDENKNTIRIRAVLERDDPPVVRPGEALARKAGFDTQWPILKIILNPTLGVACPPGNPAHPTAAMYEMLRTLVVGEVVVRVEVKGIRENLIIQSDQGIFDGTQKVFPFGPVPEVGNRFYIGSTEVFQKALATLKVNFDWIAPPENFVTHYAKYSMGNQGFSSPDPYLKIDFIDRADVSIPKQVVRFGKRTPNNDGLSGIVSDLNGTPIAGITVRLVNDKGDVVQTTTTNAEGKYTLNAGVQPNWTIEFEAPGQDDSNPGQAVFYETLLLYAEKEGDPAAPIAVGDFSMFNVVLFPKSVLFGVLPATDLVTGTVHNIYGEPITADIVIKINGQDAVLSGGNFSFGAKGNSLAIEVFTPADKYKVPDPSSVQLNGFSKIKIVLEPNEKAEPPNGAANLDTANPMLSGIIRENKTGVPKAGAYAEAQAGNLTISVFADPNGDYQLPLPTSNSSVRFFPNAYANALSSNPVQPSLPLSKAEINADLIAVNQVEKKLAGDAIAIRVKNYLGTPITSNLEFSIVRPGSTASVSPILDVDTYRLTIPSSDRSSKLRITLADFKPQEFNIDDYAEYEVVLFPFNNIQDTGAAAAGIITGNVLDADGTSLTGFTVEDDLSTPTVGTVSGNNFTITPDTAATKIIIAKAGYLPTEYSNTPLAGRSLNVILLPEMPTVTPVANAVTARLVHANAAPAANVEVLLEGELGGRYIKYRTQTAADGAFAITRLAGVTLKNLTFMAQDAFVEVAPPTAGNSLQVFFHHQVKKRRPARNTLTGTVRDINGMTAIKGVKLTASTGGNATTEDNGSFVLPLPNSGDFTVQIEHAAFHPLTVYVEQGCLELHIRLVPLPISAVVSGKVTDVFDTPVGDVSVNVHGTAIQTKSNKDGQYTIAIPFGVSPVLDMITAAGFEQKIVDLNAAFPSPGVKFSKSEMNAILFYKSINYTALLEGQTVLKTFFDVNINALNLVRDVRTQQFEKYSPTLKRGFVRFTLAETNLLHDIYPKALSYYALSKPTEAHLLNPPYSPATNNISLDYTSEQIITGTANLGADNRPIDQFFHLLPFNGHKWLSLETGGIRLIYPYTPYDQPGAPVPYATGNLFVGIAGLQPGSTLSVLFEMAYGTEQEPEKLPPLIVWSYLSPGNVWRPFGTGEVLRDDTRSLTRTGMIQFAVPTDAVRQNTLLDPNLYWLRAAAVERNSDESVYALPSIAQVRAQVVRARFKNKSNELSHLAQPLPAQSIAALAESRAEVKAVEQPLESFGGRLPEASGMAFYQRISERLRHKDRAVTVWDFEHLLLEHYPAVAVAKCIQHTRYKSAVRASELAPGYVTVAVVPDLRPRHGEPWPQPRFPQGDLDDMRDFLASKANLFVAYGQGQEAHLQVVNPLYEQVDVRVHVVFRPEYSDKAFYEQKLAEELTRFISPWLADPAVPPQFGRVLERSQILQFIEERPYVDFVDVSKNPDGTYKNFQIRTVCVNVAGEVLGADGLPLPGQKPDEQSKEHYAGDKVCPSTARSILVASHMAINAGLPSLTPCPPPPTTTGGDTTIPDQTEQTGQAAYALVADVAKAADAPAPTKKASAKKPRKTKQ